MYGHLCSFLLFLTERRSFAECPGSGPGRGTKRFLQDSYNNSLLPHKMTKSHRPSSEGILLVMFFDCY